MIPFYKNFDMVTGIKIVVMGEGEYPGRKEYFRTLETPLL